MESSYRIIAAHLSRQAGLLHSASNQVWLELKQLYEEDQKPRAEFVTYIKSFPTWEEALEAYIKDKNIKNRNDVFNDAPRLSMAKALIRQNLDTILKDKETWKLAWLLVQHMDTDPGFQRYFLNALEKAKIDDAHEEYRLLHDRVSVNTGRPQKYNTQDADKTLAEIKDSDS